MQAIFFRRIRVSFNHMIAECGRAAGIYIYFKSLLFIVYTRSVAVVAVAVGSLLFWLPDDVIAKYLFKLLLGDE